MKCTRKCTGLLLAAALVAQVVMPGAQVEAKKASKPVLSKKTVKVKEKTKKKVTVRNAKGYKLTVKSKNKKIATVSKQGKTAFVVKGVKAGKTKVVCTAKKKKKKVTLTCTVKVDKRRGNVTQPTVSPIATNNNSGVTATPEPAVTPEPTATPEPTIAPFPETDTFSDVPYGFADASENVEKGKMEEFTYVSKTTNMTHKVLVQLPANYSQEKQYPVLYLFHGENDTESIWSDMAADQIIDNAVTFKAAEDMIVVMPNISSDKDEDVMKDFADVLKPEVEAKYSVAKERHNTAVAGYGLGGRIALNIGLSLPEQVAYMGAFAPVEGLLPYDGGNGYFNNTSFRIDEKYKDVTFLMIQKGTSDDVAGEAPDSYHKTLTDNGSECLYLEMKGAHDQELFKAGLYNFARRIFKRGTQDESIVNGFVTKVPSSATKPTTHKGKIEKIEYDTETYDPGNSQKIQKWANVYLPYDYDPEKKYNILYLMHGGGENADTWIKGDNIYGDYTHNKDMINRLFDDGYCEPCIIVNPTFYRPEGAPEPSNAMDLTILFQYELRNDLIPAVEAKYSTYAGGDVSIESLKASRMHRGFAGLSMGSNTTYHSAFFGNYDLFAWFAPYSGYFGTENGNDADADRFNKIIEEGEANGMPL
ncbi:MAG: hypothetical protein HFG36_12335, partial [Eubacterium sp.]|nr:hypothetical protein [Eubacterium sp.]